MFQVFLHNSMATPSPPAYGELLAAVLRDAQDLESNDGYRLSDGSEIHVFRETGEDICLIEYPRMTPAVAETIFEIMRRTDSLMFLPGLYAFRVAGSGVEAPPTFALAFEAVGVGEMGNAQDLHDFLAAADAMEPEPASEPARFGGPEGRGLGGRISDFLFGREG